MEVEFSFKGHSRSQESADKITTFLRELQKEDPSFFFSVTTNSNYASGKSKTKKELLKD